MPNFHYKAISHTGQLLNGVIDAYDEYEAIDKIKVNAKIVTFIKQVDGKQSILHRDLGTPKVKEKDLAMLCSQYSIILRAGMPIARATELVAAQTKEKVLHGILVKVQEDVLAGYGLAQSFENKAGDILPTTFIETIRAGEETGSVDESFAKLQIYFENSYKTKGKVRNAMIYPIFILSLAVVVIAIVLVVAMPVFIDMFVSLNAELPFVTVILINISEFMQKYWLLLIAVIALFILIFKAIGRTERGRLEYARIQTKLPVLGNIAVMQGANQLSNTMATMISAGLLISRSTNICSHVMDNYYFSIRLGQASAWLEEGHSLGWCLEKCDCFPELLVEMTNVGDETGSLEATLSTMGAYYASEVALASEKAMNMLQPIITLILGLVIGFVVIALYMPMFTMYGSM